MQLLSENAIVHISAGFQGPFILQLFSLRQDLFKRGTYNFCVTDGTIYIGAKYHHQDILEIDNYNLIQVTATFQDRFHPIIIQTLEVVSTSLRKMIGNPPCTLQDYFNLQTRGGLFQGAPRKKIKLNEGASPSQFQRYGQEKRTLNIGHEGNIFNDKEEHKNNMPIKASTNTVDKQKSKRQLRLASESQDYQEQKSSHQLVVFLEQNKTKGSPRVQVQKQKDLQKTCYIKDLFERLTGWVIFCRINYMSIVQCQNGLFAVNFLLSDQIGSQIKCVYFVSDAQHAKQFLIIGNCYLFSGGQIKYSSKQKQLQITFDRNSQILLQNKEYITTISSKYIRIESIVDQDHGNMVNVIGVVYRIKTKEQLKTKTKFTATLCDPINHIQIDFMLFENNQERQIKIGMVIILHNFQVFKQQNIYRLNSTYKSYYLEQKRFGASEDIIYEFYRRLELTQWDNYVYKNLSMFAFTQRTILDLRQINKRTDDQRVYSSLDVWTLDIVKKKSYFACKNCKRPTDKKQMNLFQCIHCKKMVQTIITHALSVTFADYTGSCNIDVIGEHAENLLGKKANQFNIMNPEEQTNYLQTLKFKNVTLRLKSQKKGQKNQSHSVWGIQKPSPQITIRQIQKRIHLNRLKHQQQW